MGEFRFLEETEEEMEFLKWGQEGVKPGPGQFPGSRLRDKGFCAGDFHLWLLEGRPSVVPEDRPGLREVPGRDAATPEASEHPVPQNCVREAGGIRTPGRSRVQPGLGPRAWFRHTAATASFCAHVCNFR